MDGGNSRVLDGVKFYLGGKNKVKKSYLCYLDDKVFMHWYRLPYLCSQLTNEHLYKVSTTFTKVRYFFCHPQKQYYPYREKISFKQGYECNKTAL